MKIINIILLIFQRSLGDFYYIFYNRGIVQNQSEQAEGAGAECQFSFAWTLQYFLRPESMIN